MFNYKQTVTHAPGEGFHVPYAIIVTTVLFSTNQGPQTKENQKSKIKTFSSNRRANGTSIDIYSEMRIINTRNLYCKIVTVSQYKLV